MATTVNDMLRDIKDVFHELSPNERLKAMRNTMGKVSREIRKIAVQDLTSLNYPVKPWRPGIKGGKRTGPKGLKTNVRAVAYRRVMGFHVTVACRSRKGGTYTKFDHLNRWDKWKPAVMWLQSGTEKQDAHPFMDRAERELDNYDKRIEEVFHQKIEDIARKYGS